MSSSPPESATAKRRRRGRPPLRVGLTGGIASGKSTVAALFAQLGVPVIDTDQIARDVVAPGSPVLDAIAHRFGRAVLNADGSMNRRVLRSLVFADAGARADLEALTHPAIQAETERRSAVAGGAYQLIAVPLLAEKGLKGRYERVLVVDCDPTHQLARLRLRDGSDEREARAILAAQVTREDRLAIADEVIQNDGDLVRLARQVAELHDHYRKLASTRPGGPE